MNIFSAVFLGVVQGLTEFLPVSSSAHLVFAQSLIPGFNQPGILFDVVLHLATTLAVVAFYWKKIISIIQKDWRYIWLVGVATIPAVILGYLFNDQFEKMFSDVKSVGLQLVLTGVGIYFVDNFKEKKTPLKSSNAFLIGISQALAIVPGISRSGATIFTGSLLGIDKKQVAEFSFLMSVPAILGANVLQFVKHGINYEGNISYYVAGFVAAFIFGYLSIKVVLDSLHERKFKYFAIYCVVVGLLAFGFLK